MRLTSMTIKNFKGIDEHGVRIDFAPITGGVQNFV